MSLGVAGTDDWPGASAEQLIHEADIALYRAKELGRNRSVLARRGILEEAEFAAQSRTPVIANS